MGYRHPGAHARWYPHDISEELLDLILDMAEQNRLRYIVWDECTTFEQGLFRASKMCFELLIHLVGFLTGSPCSSACPN